MVTADRVTNPRKLGHYLVIDNDFETSQSFQSLPYACLGIIVEWADETFFTENFGDLLKGEIVTFKGSEYQLYNEEDYMDELNSSDEEEGE